MSVLHLIAFPHRRLDEDVPTCAYTAKVQKMRQMNLGRELLVYGTEGADVPVIDEELRIAMFGADDPSQLPAWPNEQQWMEFNTRVVAALATRLNVGDVVLLAGGYSQKLVADVARQLVPGAVVAEPGVGYEGVVTEACAFESRAWMHYVYGKWGIDGRPADTVIPNYFDPGEFQVPLWKLPPRRQAQLLAEQGIQGTGPTGTPGHEPYLLFLGRVTLRKGPHIAAEIAHAAGMKLIVAGPGVIASNPGRIVADHVTIEADNVEYVGPVNREERANLLANAEALLAPTLYVEPFGGVAVEAMLTGTPVLASDWGGFTETVENGITGYRFRTVEDAARRIDDIACLDPQHIRAHALDRYSLDAVAPLFRDWFAALADGELAVT